VKERGHLENISIDKRIRQKWILNRVEGCGMIRLALALVNSSMDLLVP
jgi:hypothetical protein